MENLEQRVSELENTISTLIQHIQDVNHSIATGFEKVEKHFAIINGKIDAIKGNSNASLETVENSIVNLTTEIKKINDTSGYQDLYANMKMVNKNN